MTISSLDKSETGAPYNGATSYYRASTNSDVEHGDNSPERKRKITSDSWNAIKRIKMMIC